MLKAILVALSLMSAPAFAYDLNMAQSALNSPELAQLHQRLSNDGYYFSSLIDSGLRYRCPCYEYYAVFYSQTFDQVRGELVTRKRVFPITVELHQVTVGEELELDSAGLESEHKILIQK